MKGSCSIVVRTAVIILSLWMLVKKKLGGTLLSFHV